VQTRPGCSVYECIFKLADLGTSHFRSRMSKQPSVDHRGTRTYGAPELFRADPYEETWALRTTWASDIWSLGCIFSEAAVWVVNGNSPTHGLEGYRRRRWEAHEPEFRTRDAFHNGDIALDAVDLEHKKILGQKKQCDPITQSVVNIVEEMLALDPDSRPPASNLRHRSIKMVRDAKLEINTQGLELGGAHVTQPRVSASSSGSRRRSMMVPPSMPERRPVRDDRQWQMFTNRSDPDNMLVASPKTMSVAHDIGQPSRSSTTSFGAVHNTISSPEAFERRFDRQHDTYGRDRGTTTNSMQPSPYSLQHRNQESDGTVSGPSLPSSPIRETGSPLNVNLQQPSHLENRIPKAVQPPPAHLSYSEAMAWYEKMKAGQKFAELPNHELTKELTARDHVSRSQCAT